MYKVQLPSQEKVMEPLSSLIFFISTFSLFPLTLLKKVAVAFEDLLLSLKNRLCVSGYSGFFSVPHAESSIIITVTDSTTGKNLFIQSSFRKDTDRFQKYRSNTITPLIFS